MVSVLFVAALSLGGGMPAHAQRGARRARAEQPRRPAARQRIERGHIPRNWMERLQKMSPRQQERFLENNRRFRNLPPKRQAQIRARLKQWNRLTPEQRRILIRRARIFESMPPKERREIRRVILPEWRHLPPGRRRVLVGKLRQLQGLSNTERKKRLKDPHFVQGLSSNERDLLRKLAQLKVGPGGGNL